MKSKKITIKKIKDLLTELFGDIFGFDKETKNNNVPNNNNNNNNNNNDDENKK